MKNLTNRQTQILKMIAQGKTTKEIAFELSVNTRTIDNHRSQICRKTGRNGVAGLTMIALKMGLVQIW